MSQLRRNFGYGRWVLGLGCAWLVTFAPAGVSATLSAPDPALAVKQIQTASVSVKKLLKEYEPSNDQLVIKCIRKQLTQLQTVEASALAISAKLVAARAGELRESAMSALLEQTVLAEQLVDAAKACLRIQSGEIVTYGADLPQPAGALPPEVPTPGVNLTVDPSPVDQLPEIEPEPDEEPVSDVELP